MGSILGRRANISLNSNTAILTLPNVSAPPAAAWGFRRLINGYYGNLFRLIRASDSTTLDIGQNARGEADLSLFGLFTSGTTTKVDIVYDQVGINNLTQIIDSNRPLFYLTDAFRGSIGTTHDGAATHYFNVPAGLTGDGRATTTLDVAYSGSTNSGYGAAQLGAAAFNAGGVRVMQFSGNGSGCKVTILNTAFNTSTAIAHSQPQVILIAHGPSNDTVRSNGIGSTIPAGSAGTWSGGLVGQSTVPYGFGGQFFARVIYPATLNALDMSALELACYSIYPIVQTPDFRLNMAGNSIVQGTQAVRSYWNNPRQADAYFSKRVELNNSGVFGQTAATGYSSRGQNTALYSLNIRSLVVCPEPTNDIDAYGSTSFLAVVTTVTADSSSGTNTLLNVSSTTSLSIGQYISGAGVAAGTTITNIVGTTVTISANATATGTTVTFTAKAGFTATRTIGTTGLTAVTNFNGIANGQIISGSGIPSQTTISSFNSGTSTITMSASATTSGTSAMTVTDLALVSAQAALLWSGASGVRIYFSAMVTAGYATGDCLVPTTLPRSWGSGESGSRFDGKEAVRLAYNALIAADKSGYGYTILDYANIAALSNYAGPNYADGVHPNSINFQLGLQVSGNGYGYMAKLLSDTINILVP